MHFITDAILLLLSFYHFNRNIKEYHAHLMTTKEMNTFLLHTYTHIITFPRYIWTADTLPLSLFWLRCESLVQHAAEWMGTSRQPHYVYQTDALSLFPPTLFYTPTISSPLNISTRFAVPSPSLLPSLPLCCSVSFSVSSSVLTPSPSFFPFHNPSFWFLTFSPSLSLPIPLSFPLSPSLSLCV